MTRIRDVIVPGSMRTEVLHHEWLAVTARCGRCGHEQAVHADGHTSRCKACGRVMRLDQAVTGSANVTPILMRGWGYRMRYPPAAHDGALHRARLPRRLPHRH
jgi:ribosomal protein S27E